MANDKIKKIQLGTTTYDLAVDGVDKVDGLEERLSKLEEGHSVSGTTLIIGEEPGTVLESMTKLTKIQVGEAVYDIKDPKALTELPTISGTVTKDIGGISKDKTYSNASLESVLTDLLFPYVKPDITGLAIYNASGSSVSGTHEYGTSITVAKAKPTFTKGSKPITSIKVGTSRDGSDLYSASTAASGTTYTLSTSKTYNGKTIGTNNIYCTIGDGEQTDYVTASITFSYYNYYAVTSSTTKPTSASSATNIGTDTQADITTQDNTYIWFLMPNQNKKQIQQFAMNQ